jgi:hypothetical protein
MFTITPAPLGSFAFRHFLEHVINCAPRFQTASGIAYASQVLATLDDTPGAVSELSDRGVAMLVEAITDEANELPAPGLIYRDRNEAGELVGDPKPVPWSMYRGFIAALTGASKERPVPAPAVAAATDSLADAAEESLPVAAE